MNVTSKLRALLQSEKGVKPDATEHECRKATIAALAADPAFEAKYLDSQKDEGANTFVSLLEKLSGDVAELKAAKSDPISAHRTGTYRQDAPELPESLGKEVAAGNPRGNDARVKRAHESYDRQRKDLLFPTKTRGGEGGRHPFANQPVFEGGEKGRRSIQASSQLDMACAGAYIKFAASRAGKKSDVPSAFRMTDHDWDLMDYVFKECDWGGTINAGQEGWGDNPGAIGLGGYSGGQKLRQDMIKAILDDATSGGLEAAPIFFDDMLITIPLLHSEFFPKVNVVNITRGRRIEGASIGMVTITSSTEGTAISLFNTANFIAAFDTTIFIASGAIEIGLDFLSDSPIDIAGAVSRDYQQVMLNWLDSQILGGDGTTEPEGLINASGTTSVTSTNGSGGPWTVGDIEALLFGVTKAYKGGTDPSRIGFASLETTYRRVRGIAVSTSDQRRVFGMDHENYRVFDRFWGIGSSSTGGFTSNRQILFANFARYRMYRRLGLTVTTEDRGSTLRRANTMLLIARSRWGGNLEDGAACAYSSDGMG